MKSLIKALPLFLLASAVAISCAKKESVNSNDQEQSALDAWVARNVSDPTLVRHGDGMYTEVVHGVASSAPKPEDGNWIEVLFTGYSMPAALVNPSQGSVFVTRDSTRAAIEGSTGLFKTHYAPKKIWMSLYGGQLTKAMYNTLLLMKEGETWRFYAPSFLTYGGYGTTYSYGYQGQYSLSAGVPSYMDIKLVRVIKDVDADEQVQVRGYATTKMGISNLSDSLKMNFYLLASQVTANHDSIRKDSTVSVYYVKKFLDGAIIDTNIDSIALRVFKDKTVHPAVSYTMTAVYSASNSSSLPEEAFYDAFRKMTYNSWGRMVFTSKYGFGTSGKVPTVTNSNNGVVGDYSAEVDPYMPLYYEFFVAPHK